MTRTDQHRYQRRVEALLDQIRDRVEELQRLKARGVRGRALIERKQELARTREQLAAVVGRQLAA